MIRSKIKNFISIVLIIAAQPITAQKVTNVNSFDKIIISPNIQVTFVEGSKESVTIEKSTVSNDKVHIEVNDKTLRIYLDGQKDFPKNEKTNKDGYKEKESLYKGTVVVATVTYKTLNSLSIRGEETQVCKSLLKGEKFKMTIYGESHVILDEVDLGQLQCTIYGESTLEIKAGIIKSQRYIAYGESSINGFGISNNSTKITAYGESHFQINASDAIKITAYGDAKLDYKGKAEINKGINIGDVQITKMD